MAGGGGAWKVAYADFVTAMMAFFLVMWLVGQDSSKKKAISDYFSDPWARSRLTTNHSRNPSIKEVRSGDSNPNKRFLGSDPHSIPHDDPESPDRKTPKMVTIRAPERTTSGTILYFEDSSAELTDKTKQALKNLLPNITGLVHKIDIRGHFSQHSANDHNRDDHLRILTYQRCENVRMFLKELGIEDGRMRISLAGPYEPITLQADDKSAEKNTRVEVFLINETMDSMQGTPEDRKAKEKPSGKSDSGGTKKAKSPPAAASAH